MKLLLGVLQPGWEQPARGQQFDFLDTVGDAPTALPLSHFLNALEERGELPKTILFNLNEQDNTVLSALTGTFHEAGVPGKMQFGTAWWFQDHKDGMEKQLHTLADHGLLGRFIGMLTDSRSFLSYTRHEYFRRIFCNFLGELVENGEYPEDEAMLEKMVCGVCFENARTYFGL